MPGWGPDTHQQRRDRNARRRAAIGRRPGSGPACDPTWGKRGTGKGPRQGTQHAPRAPHARHTSPHTPPQAPAPSA
eukprot:75602-Alexandrium_andersonii.AAC.1